MHLLLVEDDRDLAHGLQSALAQSGYVADVASTGQHALNATATVRYQGIVLDLALPDIDGVEVLRLMRHRGITTPVLILTARDELQDRVLGLDAGADDYLGKPFDIAELEARIRALVRRGDSTSATFRCGSVVFEPASRRMTVHDRDLALTASELAIMELLVRRAGRVVSKRLLFDSLHGWDNNASLSSVEVYVSRLRRKLADANAGVCVRVFRGLGYRLEPEATSIAAN